MRHIRHILFLLTILASCVNPSTQTNLVIRNPDSIPKDSIPVDNSNYQDTLIETIKKVTPSTFPDCRIEIKQRTKLNDKVLFILYELSDGVSQTTYLMSFADNHYKDYEPLEQSADQDYSISHYEYRDLKQTKDNNFIVANYTQTVADKNVLEKDNTFFKEGFSFENVKINTDSTIISLTVTSNGTIKRDTIK